MKKFCLYCSVLMALLLMLTGCRSSSTDSSNSQSSSDPSDSKNEQPIGNWREEKYLGTEVELFYNGLAPVWNDFDKLDAFLGLCDKNGKLVTEIKYNFHTIVEGKRYVGIDPPYYESDKPTRHFLIQDDGTEIKVEESDVFWDDPNSNFGWDFKYTKIGNSYGVTQIENNKKEVLLDLTDGEDEIKYIIVQEIGEDTILMKDIQEETFGAINSKGEWTIEPKFTMIGYFNEKGYALATEEDIDYEEWVRGKSDDLIGPFGLIDYKGEYVVEPKFYLNRKSTYSRIEIKEHALQNVQPTQSNTFVIESIDVPSFSEGLCPVWLEDGEPNEAPLGYINEKGKVVIELPKNEDPDVPYQISRFSEDLAFFSYHEKIENKSKADSDDEDYRSIDHVQFINKKGKVVIDLTDKRDPESVEDYTITEDEDIRNHIFYALPFKNGLSCFYVTIDGEDRYGFINKEGEVVIPAVLEDATYFKDPNYAILSKWADDPEERDIVAAVIDREGNYIIPYDLKLGKIEHSRSLGEEAWRMR